MHGLLMLPFRRLEFNRLHFLRLFVDYFNSNRRFKVVNLKSFPSLPLIPCSLDSNDYFPKLFKDSYRTDNAVGSYD
jgi:hypothetical protein